MKSTTIPGLNVQHVNDMDSHLKKIFSWPVVMEVNKNHENILAILTPLMFLRK